MITAQLRKQNQTETASIIEAREQERERARVYVEHMSKSPLDAPLCARIVDALEADDARREGYFQAQAITTDEVMPLAEAQHTAFTDAYQPQRGAGCAGNSADEYSSDTEGRW